VEKEVADMVVEILYNEICNNNGDGQNVTYLQATLPDAEFVFTALNDVPFFAENDPDILYIGSMSEETQRKVIKKLAPYNDRINYLVEKGTPILATGNAGDIFCKEIHYITEKIDVNGLGIFDLNVKTDWFKRYHSKVLGKLDNLSVVGFRAQFNFVYGDNSNCYFLECQRGVGINPDSKLEGFRKNNLICTQIIGPILPLNPLFCEYFLNLAGINVQAAFKDAAMRAYEQRLKEFEDPATAF
jgi:CobQ-like glutamine amidotransferase family enzyme